jgi:hypothetical protein
MLTVGQKPAAVCVAPTPASARSRQAPMKSARSAELNPYIHAVEGNCCLSSVEVAIQLPPSRWLSIKVGDDREIATRNVADVRPFYPTSPPPKLDCQVGSAEPDIGSSGQHLFAPIEFFDSATPAGTLEVAEMDRQGSSVLPLPIRRFSVGGLSEGVAALRRSCR